MRTAHLPVVKICCISSVEEARLAVAAGASALGLVSAMPSGPGVIPDGRIAEIAMSVPPAVTTFLLTAKQAAASIAAQHRFCGTSTIQMVDQVPSRELQLLRRMLPGIKLVQVIHVTDESSFDETLVAEAVESVVPFRLDLCSSVRSQAGLDEAKLRAFFDAVSAISTS